MPDFFHAPNDATGTNNFIYFLFFKCFVLILFLLQRDIVNHGGGLMKAAGCDDRYRYLDEMVPLMIQEK